MVSIAIMGACGRMGSALVQAVKNFPNLKLAAAVEQPGHPMVGIDSGTVAGCPPTGVPVTDDPEAAVAAADVVIDFTFHTVVPAVAECVRRHRKAYVLGTTGLTPDELASVEAAAQVVPVLMAPNMSLGVNLLLNLVKQAAAVLDSGYDAEIVEMHHRHKKDAPSGTARRLLEIVRENMGGLEDAKEVPGRDGIVGERTKNEIGILAMRGGDIVGEHTVFFTTFGERIELTHRATSREILSSGAVTAMEFLAGKPAGLYTMYDVLGF